MVRTVFVVVGLFAFLCVASAQPHIPTSAEYESGLAMLRSSAPQWRSTINTVDPETLGVSYAEGKRLDQEKEIVLQNLDQALKFAEHVRVAHMISDEIGLMSSIQSFQNELNSLSMLLMMFEMPNLTAQKKANSLSEALGSIANGKLNDIYSTAYLFVLDRAETMQNSCTKVR